MTRGLTTAFKNETLASELRPITLVELDFSGGTVNFWTGEGDLTWDSKTWTGTGTLLSIDAVNESTDIAAHGVQLQLDGVPSALLSTILTEYYQGRSAVIYLAALNSSLAVVADPFILWKGRMDTMLIQDGAESATITMTAENRLIDLERQRERRYTDLDQKNFFPTDKGLEHVADQLDRELNWGNP